MVPFSGQAGTWREGTDGEAAVVRVVRGEARAAVLAVTAAVRRDVKCILDVERS